MIKTLFYCTIAIVVLLSCSLFVIPPRPQPPRLGDLITKTNYEEKINSGQVSVWAGNGGSETKTYVIPTGWDYVTHTVQEKGRIGDASLNHTVNEDGKRIVSVSITAKASKRDSISFDGRPSIGGLLTVKIRKMSPVVQKSEVTQADVRAFYERLGIKTYGDKVKWRLENNPVVSVALLLFSAVTAVLALWSQLLKLSEQKKTGAAA